MSWTCDGVPKNGKTYHGLGGAHTPFQNDSPDCEDCGLPQESSQGGGGVNGGNSGQPPIGAIVAGLAAIVIAGGGGYWWTQVRCPTGFERIAGQCEDPYRETYQKSIDKGQLALDSAIKAKDPKELSEARTALDEAIVELNGIPADAAVSREAVNQSSLFNDELKYIDILINEGEAEKAATDLATKAKDLKALQDASDQLKQVAERLGSVPKTSGIFPKTEERLKAVNPKVNEVTQLQSIESLVTTAKQNTDTAKQASSITALESVKTEWNKILKELDKVPDSTFLAAKVKENQDKCNEELRQIQDLIEDLIRPTPGPTGISTPVPIYQEDPPTYRRDPEPPYRPDPVPSDPCAVEPKPSTCLF